MSVYRARAGRRGCRSRRAGSAKMEDLRPGLAIASCVSRRSAPPHAFSVRPIWVAAVLTLYTGLAVLLDGRRALGRRAVRVEIVAVGTELLLGQIADTNSASGSASTSPRTASPRTSTSSRRQPRADRARPSHRARAQRRGDRLRRARPDPGRHHPRGHRRGDERAARARRGRSSTRIATMFFSRRAGHARQQPPPGRRAAGRDDHRADARHRAGPDLPGRATRSSTPCPACPTR